MSFLIIYSVLFGRKQKRIGLHERYHIIEIEGLQLFTLLAMKYSLKQHIDFKTIEILINNMFTPKQMLWKSR